MFIAEQRFNKRCSRYIQQLEIKLTCYIKMKTLSRDNANNRYEKKTFKTVSSSPSDCRRYEIREDQIRRQIRGKRSRTEIREETSSAKNQKKKRERRRASQVASSGRCDFRVIVIAIVNNLSNKPFRLIPNPLTVTEPRTRDNMLINESIKQYRKQKMQGTKPKRLRDV
jgi:alpha-galactosidase/6-phospho-beta-glucosidase family protein